MKTTILLHKTNIDEFLIRLKELNRKLIKKNLPEVEFFISGVDFNQLEITLETTMKTTNIKGIDVHFEGVVDLVNQEEESKVYHLDNPLIQKLLPECECDECHKKIGRNKYIVFSKGNVESRKDLFVLGTSCAKNYFPFNIESYIGNLSYELESFWDLDETRGGSNSYLRNTIDFERLYLGTCDATNNLEFYHKEGETKVDACNLVFDRKYKPSEPKVSFETIKGWLISAYKDDDSEFGSNVRSVIFNPNKELRERISLRQLGLAIYSFIGAKRWHDKEIEKQIAAERKLNEDMEITYFGNVGDKFEKELIFDKSFGYETDFGYNYIHIFHDSDNHVFKWSTGNGTYKAFCKYNGNEGYSEFETGKKYLIKGSIKSHSEYNGTRQTVITRCKVVGDEYESHVFNIKDVA